jgi:SAM-dependent methyltransferase
MKSNRKSDALAVIESQRLYPAVTNPNFLVLRSRRVIFQSWISQIQGSALKILDIGGRYQPYRRLFRDQVRSYIACDLLRTELVDVVASGESLPFAADTFDAVIATQVFEYFLEPKKAADEVRQVLKPGGVLLMSVASTAPRFVDDECWRFTPKGIRATLQGFRDIQIIPEASSIGGLFRTANLASHTFAHFSALQRLHKYTLCPLLNLAGLGLERATLSRNDQFSPNYSVLARKALSNQPAG